MHANSTQLGLTEKGLEDYSDVKHHPDVVHCTKLVVEQSSLSS